MTLGELTLLRYFEKGEKDYYGNVIDWSDYHGKTMGELDRLRSEIGSPCIVIRGGASHGIYKETAVDFIFPDAPFYVVVMALFKSGFSKGIYQGGSIHLDMRMAANWLARAWMGFKPENSEAIADMGLANLKNYSANGWDYYTWGHRDSWKLLGYLIEINT